MFDTCGTAPKRARTSETAERRAAGSAEPRDWIRTVSCACFGKAWYIAFSARPASPGPLSCQTKVFVPSAPPMPTAKITKASQLRIAFLRCCADQRPARAAKFMLAFGSMSSDSRAGAVLPSASRAICAPSQGRREYGRLNGRFLPRERTRANGDRRPNPAHEQTYEGVRPRTQNHPDGDRARNRPRDGQPRLWGGPGARPPARRSRRRRRHRAVERTARAPARADPRAALRPDRGAQAGSGRRRGRLLRPERALGVRRRPSAWGRDAERRARRASVLFVHAAGGEVGRMRIGRGRQGAGATDGRSAAVAARGAASAV